MSRECRVVINKQRCPCTFESCGRRGRCCECVTYHRQQNELPACYFPRNVEKTYDRSIRKFIECHSIKRYDE
ncbi:MAG: DUF6485 family protein [candidate division WOR-3 bacterium]|nr:DUF6485 family protein [candidate division WOR-3 bacterium]MCX7757366.1 DUF6485 family protein [candidate division WOR-3 bacterium]MDW7987492.1 DUF6485 family protein [candidate division WOR-3 bacterium]